MVSRERPRHVLLVYDNTEVDDALSSGLVKKGYNERANNETAMALEEFAAGSYDVALLDVRMSPMDGLELSQRLREIDRDLLVFFLTAYADAVKEWPTGTRLIQKPVTLGGLSKALEDIEGMR